MGDTTDIKKGAIIKRDGDLYVVTFCQFVNPGKGSAFTKTKMKSVTTGKTIENTYKSSESVDTVQVERQNMQYLYKNANLFSFMNKDTYETVEVDADVLGDDAKFLKEGLEVVAMIYNDAVVAIDLPKKVSYTVVAAPPAEKGNTASGNVSKEVDLDNGHKIYAPIFIKEGDVVVVSTETGEYDSRQS